VPKWTEVAAPKFDPLITTSVPPACGPELADPVERDRGDVQVGGGGVVVLDDGDALGAGRWPDQAPHLGPPLVGGVVVVQYNTPEFDHNYGPYPYVMSNDPEEVTDENSKIDILEPSHPLFNWPNKITAHDFDGWIEERGSKFLQSWDPHYSALLETHDKGQPEQRGGLVYAKYGKGIYVYNAYAFYRQLPLGVPGAYRIFANLLSLPKNPQVHEIH